MAATSTERVLRIVSVSCGRDQRSHQFPDEETVAGLHARTGRYVMVGDHTVIGRPVPKPADPLCRCCPLPVVRRGSRPGWHPRPGLLTCLCGGEQPVRPPAVPPAPPPGWDSRALAAVGPESTLASSGPAALQPIVGTVGGIW